MTIRTKAELLEIFGDNATGNITAQDLRDFVNSNLSFLGVRISTTPFTLSNMNDAAVALPGSSLIILPPVDSYGDRIMSIVNNRGQSVLVGAAAGDTISGESNITVPDRFNVKLTVDPAGNNWLSELVPDEPTILNLLDVFGVHTGNAGAVLVVTPAEDGMEFKQIDSARVFAAQEGNAVDTVPITDGVFLDAALTLVGLDLLNFTVAGAVLTYTGADPVKALVHWDLFVRKGSGGGADVNARFKLHVNGVSVGAMTGRDALTTGSGVGVSVHVIVDLVQNDTIELRVASIGNTRAILITDTNVTVLAR